mmetsp:Transcript_12959/g.27931  ORF Transcript_12959/g.27931 Transcript_12959/m.27931 type:complete len:212 (+) Transcript_12959:80-715(+)
MAVLHDCVTGLYCIIERQAVQYCAHIFSSSPRGPHGHQHTRAQSHLPAPPSSSASTCSANSCSPGSAVMAMSSASSRSLAESILASSCCSLSSISFSLTSSQRARASSWDLLRVYPDWSTPSSAAACPEPDSCCIELEALTELAACCSTLICTCLTSLLAASFLIVRTFATSSEGLIANTILATSAGTAPKRCPRRESGFEVGLHCIWSVE